MNKALDRIKKSHKCAMGCLGIEDNDPITLEAIEDVEKDLKRLDLIESYLDKWLHQLSKDGYNTKMMVLNDIQYLIKTRRDKKWYFQ